MITITKKVRAWDVGESIQPVDFDVAHIADAFADHFVQNMRDAGDDPITVTVQMKISATVLNKGAGQ